MVSPRQQRAVQVIASLLLWAFPAAVSAAVAVAEPFRVLSDGSEIARRYGAEPGQLPTVSGAHLVPTAEEEQAGFVVGRAPLAASFGPAWVWEEPRPESCLSLFAMRGEYRAAVLGIHALRDLYCLQAGMSPLAGPGPGVVAPAQADTRCVRYLLCRDGGEERWVNRFLVPGFPPRVPAGTTSFLWLSIQVPPDALPGVYLGQVGFAEGAVIGAGVSVPVRLRVLDRQFRYPHGAWGTYLPGHFCRETDRIYHNYALADWTESTLDCYFRFWQTHGLTSPSLFHIYPDLACVDGKTVAEFPEVRAVAQAMRRAGLDGPLCLDLRHTLWWANVAGRVLEEHRGRGQEATGRLEVVGAAGQMASQYGPDALRLWREAIEAFLQAADREQWPAVLLLPEEECSDVHKGASYDASVAAFKAAVGARSLLVDNSIGYGRAGEIDRGHRDGIAVREYNNWTEEGLANARADGAAVWSYNLGWTRAAVWLYTLRTGSTGYHQWADQWLHDRFPLEWVATLIEPDGVVTSTDMEMLHEGLCDLAYAQCLQDEADRLDAAGQRARAAAARGVLATLVDGVPIQRYAFLAWASTLSDADLDLRRWRLVEALEQAAPTRTAAPGRGPAAVASRREPRLAAAAPRQAGLTGNPARVLHANRIPGTMTPDGREEEPFWAGAERAGPLWWTGARERQMRAQAGSLEEFRRLNPPSYASARFVYGAEGLGILVNCNHATQERSRCTHADDDPELWADDCMEFFFQTPHEPASVYQLIVNVRGARVLKRDRADRRCGVRTGTVSPVNASGGYAQEIVVPWGDLGLAEPPEPGTVWRLNVCREFHSWGELTCWAQVEEYFGLADGALVFEGPAAEVALRDLDLGHRYAGRNRLSGRVERRTAGELPAYRVELADGEARPVAAAEVSAETGRFEIAYTVPPLARPDTWRLAVTKAGQAVVSMELALPAVGPSVLAETTTIETLAGFRVTLPVTVCLGDEDVPGHPLTGDVRDAGGRLYALAGTPLGQAGPHRVWLDTDGLAPGPAALRLWLDGLEERGVASVALSVVAAPFGP